MADYSDVHHRTGTRAKAASGQAGSDRLWDMIFCLLMIAFGLIVSLSMVKCAGNAPGQDGRPQYNPSLEEYIRLPENFELPQPLEVPEFPELPGLPEMPEELQEALENYTQP